MPQTVLVKETSVSSCENECVPPNIIFMYKRPQILTAERPIDPLTFRNTLGSFASGVVVVTTVSDEGEVHGMTANGFVSVSLDPPLILVSVGDRARMHQKLMDSPRYGISILAEDQLHIAQHFAGKPQEIPPVFLWRDGLPLLEGALGHLMCSTVDRHPAGDHTLFIAQVNDLAHTGGAPLTFHAGAFGTLAKGPTK